MSTRQDILNHLEKKVFASAEDLAQVCAKTRANIQYHLKQMELSGIITPVFPTNFDRERGRPRRFYSLSPSERPHNLVMLADALLLKSSLILTDTPEAQSQFLNEIGNQIVHLNGTPSSTTTRLNRLVSELSQRGYQARWEAQSGGPEIVFRNCPYAALLPAHPELCRMDALILERHLGIPIIQRTRIQLPGVPGCRFANQPKNE